MALIYCDGENELAKAYAKRAAEALVLAYPNNSLWVECRGGLLIIKHFAISGQVGMVRHTSALDASSAIFQKEIIRAAGELLERAGLARASYSGEEVEDFEGEEYRKYWLKRPGHATKVIH